MIKILDNKWILLILLILPVVLLGSIRFGETYYDSKFMVQTANFIAGDPEEILFYDEYVTLASPMAVRVLTPLLATIFFPLFSPEVSFAIVNLLFWVASSLLIYQFFREFFKSKQLGFYAALAFSFSLPVIVWGTGVLTDMSGYFFLFLGIFVIEKLARTYSWKNYAYIGLILSLALLARDQLMLLWVYLLLTILFDKNNNLLKSISHAPKYLFAVVLSYIPLQLWSHFTGLSSGNRWLKEYFFQALSFEGLKTFVFRSSITFHYFWIIFMVGVINLWKHLSSYQKEFYIKVFLSTCVFVVFSFLFANYSPRYTFLMFPLVIPLAVHQLHVTSQYLHDKKIFNYNFWMFLFLLLYLVISLVGTMLYPTERVRYVGSLLDIVLREAKWKSLIPFS